MVEGIAVVPVQPHELHDWWDAVVPDLDVCRVQDKEETWREDIYCAIKGGHAFLYVGTKDGDYCGCMVVTRHFDQWQPRNSWLHVWYCNTQAGVEMIDAGLNFLDALAKQQGAKFITFRTNRLAFERWGRKLGFEVGEIELRREVN